MSYEETLQYLYAQMPAFHQVGGAAYKPGLENTVKLMSALGNPHQHFKSIHVGGTNGKGSVSHWLSAILQSAGYKVGLYTSPHLVDFGERIRINGEMIDCKYVIDFVEKRKKILEQIKPSFFEATMAMAFRYFADKQVDIAIIEVGLGGRLDSTNIITPMLSVITNIGLEHTEFLGNTLVEIATEKAGIIKSLVPVVIGETVPETREVFEETAMKSISSVYFAENRYRVKFCSYTENGKMNVQVESKDFSGTLVSGLTGMYQLKNLATVLTAVEVLKKEIKLQLFEYQVSEGIENVVELTGLQGRWQTFPSKPKVILDTGHNLEGIREVVQMLNVPRFNKLHIIFGVAKDKNVEGILAILPKMATYYFTQANTQRAMNAQELHKIAENQSLTGMAFDTVSDAIYFVKRHSSPRDLIFIGGSNFVVGEALAELAEKENL